MPAHRIGPQAIPMGIQPNHHSVPMLLSSSFIHRYINIIPSVIKNKMGAYCLLKGKAPALFGLSLQ
jgi:hypothetical protein